MDEIKLLHQLIDIFKFKENYQHQTSQLQPQDMYTLERIYFHESMRVMDVAKKYHIAPSTLTGIIDRLCKKGFIERIRIEEDRRAVEIKITDKGRGIVQQHMDEDQAFVKNFFDALQEDKRKQFKILLTELVQNINRDKLFELDEEDNS